MISAMRQELRPILKRFALRAEASGDGRVHLGRAGSREVVAAVTSVGTEAARQVTGQLLDAFPVDHVIVVGIAGGIDPELRIGELVNPVEVVEEATGAAVHPVPLVDEAPRGRLITSDVLHDSADALERLRREGFVAVDMETATIGAAAEARDIPWSVCRAISDLAGESTLDRDVVGLANPDGSANIPAVARFVLTKPWRLPGLAALARGTNRAIATSTDAVVRALG